ncbi:hypothetical protein CDL12_04473 [Handroanthus impetiginosus]|uniref:Retrovirus-related Pol polyprotein from transposon TNT 1-94-like beta-barrel domain-containing protein n=1 Tax=Handroanthus impetiginosus TaxID=429701 RepID=A0A2G9HZ64_9LAMI|nr:hypothetical protein CDL12_04473 [Handroanthus impetiginosus]
MKLLLLQIGIKLDCTNYGLWSQVVKIYISGKDKLGCLNGDLPQPHETDPTFRRWRTENALVKDQKLIGNYIRFPTAKAVWDAIATTYFDGVDISQVYDPKRKEDRVYTFLDGLDDRLNKVQGDVLQLKPFPTVEQAYALVRREDLRQSIMLTKDDSVHGSVMISKGGQRSQLKPFLQMANRKFNISSKSKPQTQEGGCSHCENMKHTRDICFKLHGYPNWWHELKAKRNMSQAKLHSLTLENLRQLVNQSSHLYHNNKTNKIMALNDLGKHNWIIDSGAIDHMTFDPQDLVETTKPRRKYIANANGVTYPVTGVGKVALSSNISLRDTLLVPSLSNKLLSIGQATDELNCCVLIYLKFCLF